MAKSFKKISVILFVMLLTALLIVGCAFLANTGKVSQSENLDNKNSESIFDTSETVTDNVVDPKTNTLKLSGPSDEMMATGWNNAIKYSTDNNVEVKVILGKNWTATSDSTLVTSFGSGVGFKDGAIVVPSGAKITLDLNGKTVNRNLTKPSIQGQCFIVNGTLNLLDKNYNSATVSGLNSLAAIQSNTTLGKVTGAYPGSEINAEGRHECGSAFSVYSGTLNMYGGVLYKNNHKGIGSHSGTVGLHSGTFNMYGGLIAFNSVATAWSAVGGQYAAKINLYGGIIRNNETRVYNGDYGSAAVGIYAGRVDAVNVNDMSKIGIGAGIQIYDNYYLAGEEHVQANLVVNQINQNNVDYIQKIKILEPLQKSGVGATYVGIRFHNRTEMVFAENYGAMANGIPASRFFFSDDTTKRVADIATEAKLETGTERTDQTVWSWSGAGTGSTTKAMYAVPYTGGTYNIKCSAGFFTYLGDSTSYTTYPASQPGIYVFYRNLSNLLNPYFTFVIGEPNKVAKLGAITSIVYTGNEITCGNPVGFNSSTMTIVGGNKGTNVGTYVLKVGLKEPRQYWEDGTVVSEYNWQITRKPIDIPTAGTNSFVYNTASQTYTPAGFNSTMMSISGNTGTVVNSYTAKVTPTGNYQWKNNGTDTTGAVSLTWSITPKPLTKPTLSTEPGFSTPTYNGQTITVPTVGFDSNTMDITGNTGIDAGKKTAVITLKDTSNYKWADNSTGSVSLNWEIVKQEVAKPTQATQNVFVYDGNKKVYTPKGFDANKMILTDNEAIEANEYVAKVNLKPNYQWLGKTEEELTFKYTIVPPGLVVKEGIDYDFIYTDNGTWNQRYTYGESYQHKMNDQELNQVGGDNVYILGKVQPNTTIAQFLDNIDSDRDFIKIYNNFGELVYDGTANEVASTVQYIGTSYKVELYVTGESGLEILDEVYISILGDLNADGIVNSADMAMMRRLLNGDINLYSLPLERVLAVYLDNKGGLTSVDQELLNGLVAGRITSNELFEEQELLGEEESYKYIDLVDGRRVQASTESAVIGNVTAGTSISEFVDKVAVFLSVGGASNITSIYNNVGELVYKGIEGIQAGHSMQEYVGTGWKVQVNGRDTEYTVSVLGDVTGDGIINAMDVTYLRRIANDNKLLAELEARGNKAVLLAATISNRGGICTADSEILWGTICGTMDLSRYN